MEQHRAYQPEALADNLSKSNQLDSSPFAAENIAASRSQYDNQVKYVRSRSVLLADTLSRLIKPGSARAIPGLDVDIALVLKVEPTRLKTLQEETKADFTLAAPTDLIITFWLDSTQDLPGDLSTSILVLPKELTILDGLVMKGNKVIIPLSMEPPIRLHDAHQGLSLTLQRARRTLYWPWLQNDITETVQTCRDCQRYGNKQPRIPERQISAIRPMEILRMHLVRYRGQHALVTVHYFPGFLAYDILDRKTNEAVTKVLNNISRKFGLAQKINSMALA